MRKILHALWIGLVHVFIILTAHSFAERGIEVAGLIRDEWMIGGAEKVAAAFLDASR